MRYNKDILLVETAYPFTADDNDNYENVIRTEEQSDYPFTPEGQASMPAAVMAVIRATPNGRGLGVMWWDATWTAVPGNGWENQALFDYDHCALPAMSLFKQDA